MLIVAVVLFAVTTICIAKKLFAVKETVTAFAIPEEMAAMVVTEPDAQVPDPLKRTPIGQYLTLTIEPALRVIVIV